MGSHEEFRELCAAAIAGELTTEELGKLDAHLAGCSECRQTKREYELAVAKGMVALAEDRDPKSDEVTDSFWSVEKAEEAFFQRLKQEEKSSPVDLASAEKVVAGRRYAYRPSQIRWREIWMPFAAAILLALALGIAAYRSGVNRGADVARITVQPIKESENSLEAQVSDVGYERAQLEAKLAANAKIIDRLKRRLSEQSKTVNSLESASATAAGSGVNHKENQPSATERAASDEELSAAQAKLSELQKTVEEATAQRDENARQAAVLEARVNQLTQLVTAREQALEQKEVEVTKGQELLAHDRDIRELMGARELYMADVHDVSGRGTDKTYGRVFYTKGKSLIFYAFDLDAQPGMQNAKSFQAWGRKGPDKEQARSLGIFYEDNVSKKRWVLKADDPKTLADIDAVFVTVEPHGGSQHPSGKQLLFAYLRIGPNHP